MGELSKKKYMLLKHNTKLQCSINTVIKNTAETSEINWCM